MSIIGEAIVSCYADITSLLVMILLLILADRLHKRGNASMQILFRLSLCITATCVFSFLYHAAYRQSAPAWHTIAVISRTLWEFTCFRIIVNWVAFVTCKLFGPEERRSRKFYLVTTPFMIFTVLLVVNMFTGIIFTCNSDNMAETGALYNFIVATEFFYFIVTAVICQYYDRKSAKIRFLNTTPMILSVALAVSVQFFTPYQIDVLGFVIGVTLLYFSMVSEFRFVDEESGLYNRGYLAYLFDLALAGKNNERSALILDAEGSLPPVFAILHDALHQNGDVIRTEERRFLLFTKTDSRSTLQYLASLVTEGVEQYNAQHPEDQVRITARSRIKTADENSFEFLRGVMENREAGNEMRDIVSMISELDRLDEELRLASDIQVNMLPMIFPPFPDRTEFDLYASMTPAKEVGGDFYDFFLTDSDHLAMVIADVSGKGIPAALFMMVSKTLLKNQLMSGCDPAAALERVNVQLYDRNSSMMFVTVWLAVIEISTGRGKACNAGHENPVMKRAGGEYEVLRYRHNMALGISKMAKYTAREFELHPGDSLFVYTDGVPEATNNAMEMFGEERLVSTLNQHRDTQPEEVIAHMREAVDAFADGAPQFDDVTMLCLKYLGRMED